MISYTPTPRYDYLEEVTATKINKALAGKLKPSATEQAQEELATTIHKSLVGQLKPSDTDIIKSLRKESRRYV